MTSKQSRLYQVTGYNDQIGGWRRYGHLVVNFVRGQVTSVWFKGEQIL